MDSSRPKPPISLSTVISAAISIVATIVAGTVLSDRQTVRDDVYDVRQRVSDVETAVAPLAEAADRSEVDIGLLRGRVGTIETHAATIRADCDRNAADLLDRRRDGNPRDQLKFARTDAELKRLLDAINTNQQHTDQLIDQLWRATFAQPLAERHNYPEMIDRDE